MGSQLTGMLSSGRLRLLQPGELLWQAGDAADCVVLLEAGTLEVVQHSPQGEDAVLNRLHAGELAGEMSCLDGQPHSATLRAASTARVRCLDRQAFLEWVSAEPQRCLQLLHRLCGRLRQLSARLAEVSFEPVQLRLARFLLEQPDEINITQQQIGEYLAATRESVSKALNRLARTQAVEIRRGKLRVCDRAQLRSLLAEFGNR